MNKIKSIYIHMGGTQSQLDTKAEVKNMVKSAASEDKILIDKIINKSRELFKQNKENFLDENFCNKIAITYTKKLYELPLQQIKEVYNNIENNNSTDLELNMKYDNLKEEKFLVNELSGRLSEHFKGKKLKPTMFKGINISYPDVYYVQNRALKLLGEINDLELKKRFVGGNMENNYPENNENNLDENNEENDENNYEDEEEIVNIEPTRNYQSETIKNAKKELENILRSTKNNKNSEKKSEKPENKSEKSENKSEKQENKSEKQENRPEKKQENRPEKKNKMLNILESKVKMENIAKLKNVKPKNIEVKPQTKSVKEIEASGDRYCIDEEKCKLTKMEMCEKIVYHFIVRNNLIAAILSTVPFPSKDGEYKGSFTFERLKSLQKGVFCLPPYEDIKYKNEKFENDELKLAYENKRISKILQYINILDHKQCVANGGRLLVLKKEQIEELARNDNLGRKYVDFVIKINNFYQNALIVLYDVLENLQNNVKISTKGLNIISEKTKEIIDELYLKTQFNYLLAVMVILEFKFEDNSQEENIKNNRIQKIIKEDFNL